MADPEAPLGQPLPTGTVTFLFTDIEGSTRKWQEHAAAMPAALSRHHALLRQAIESNRGYVFQIIGDAFCAAFATAPDGLAAAVAAQRALCDEPWGETGPIRVRMALHTGAAQVRPGERVSGQYVSGLTLSRAARLLSAGHGGQILLSQPAYDLAADQLPPGGTVRDLGEHRLKDLFRPEHIYQLAVPETGQDFAPLKSLDALPNNLPIQLTAFIGREREMAQVRRLLASARLLTLTGVGGTGKTRLALQVAADFLDAYPDGVWFVELAPLSDPALVPQAAAAALSIREEAGRSILSTLADYLRGRNLLLILDNCEHLTVACAGLADSLLRTCPGVRVLATSREALGIEGEVLFSVPSLTAPHAGVKLELARAAEYEAINLFVERARQVAPAFTLTDRELPAVAQVCQRLDGIPLAIELAAARVRLLSVEQIARRVDDRFRLLTGGSRAALPRHQTLRALIDWSYDLLSEPERVLFRRLSACAGGCSLEAIEQVGAGEDIQEADVLDLLTHLVDKSLLVVEEQPEEARYRLYETIRQYARDKLLESNEADAVRGRHARFFLALAEQAEPNLHGPEQIAFLNRLDVEQDNLRAAFEWFMQRGDYKMALRLALAQSGTGYYGSIGVRAKNGWIGSCPRSRRCPSRFSWRGRGTCSRWSRAAAATLRSSSPPLKKRWPWPARRARHARRPKP